MSEMNAVERNDRYWAEKRGLYAPPAPFPKEGTEEFAEQINLMMSATRTFIERIFEYTPTMIELHHWRRIAHELAQFYASVKEDGHGWDRISHIPMEVFRRFLLEQGWDMKLVHDVTSMNVNNTNIPKSERWFYLQREQEQNHLLEVVRDVSSGLRELKMKENTDREILDASEELSRMLPSRHATA